MLVALLARRNLNEKEDIMKLGDVFQGISAWNKLVSAEMKPALAYRLMKYANVVFEEHDLIEKKRVDIVHKVTGTKPGTQVQINTGTEEFEKYASEFTDVLEVESLIRPFRMELVDVLDGITGSESFSVQDLSLLEPFFAGDSDGKATEDAG